MRYPIAIEPGNADQAWGVVVPDLPGCYSAGDTLDEAMDQAREAIELWLETVLEDGGDIPSPLPIEQHRSNSEYTGWLWAIIEIDPTRISRQTMRLNISLPASLVHRIDAYATDHHLTRSGFLAKAAIESMHK
ncbi:MAG: type II toxin-antitoxin system HicB family antitoxin [Chromatiales bacterium]|nr:type II toxin-antitoxin system HicB family antitoxin [Chromatiales bacterium]